MADATVTGTESVGGKAPESSAVNPGETSGVKLPDQLIGKETLDSRLRGNNERRHASGDSESRQPDTGGDSKSRNDESGGARPEGGKQESEGEKKSEPEPRAPEEYADFTVPEGLSMDEAQTAGFKSFAKEQDLTQEQAQKVLEYGAERIREIAQAPYKAWNDLNEKWQSECKADPEIGGTKFEQSIKDSALVFQPGEGNPFVSTAEEAKALREALNTTGAGNNPAIVKVFVRMGRMLAEPGRLSGNPNLEANAKPNSFEDRLNKMYPSMNSE